MEKKKEIQIKECRLASDTITYFDKWSDPTAVGFIVEWSLEKIYNGKSTKELDNFGIDFVSAKGTTYQVKCSMNGENSDYRALARKVRNATKIILAYADREEKKVFYTVQ